MCYERFPCNLTQILQIVDQSNMSHASMEDATKLFVMHPILFRYTNLAMAISRLSCIILFSQVAKYTAPVLLNPGRNSSKIFRKQIFVMLNNTLIVRRL